MTSNNMLPDVDNKKRQQLTDIIGISISPARCAAHLKKNLFNKDIDNEIHELKEKIKNSKDEEEIFKLKSSLSLLSQKIIRISNETSTVMAVICNGFIEDLLKHSINETLANNKKMVDINYIMSGDHKKNLYYSIYYKLPTFVNYDSKVYEELKKKKSEENKKNKNKKNKSDDNTITTLDEDSTDITNNSEDGKTTFNTYIDAVLKNVKKDLQLSDNIKIRTSIEVRDFLSDMIIDCIKRFVILSKIFVQQIMGVRTMNANHIKAIVHMFMKDEGNTDEQIDLVINNINEKLRLFHFHIMTEKNNKLAELNEEKRSEFFKKQEEKTKNKKKRELQNAEKRILETNEKVKKLTEEIKLF
jgi:hypothetical protein